MNEVRRFVVTERDHPTAIVAALSQRSGVKPMGTVVVERTFLDTADGRLHGDGIALELRRPTEGTDAPMLVWVEDSRVVASAEVDAASPPRFAADLPPWPNADRLGDLMEIRALIPGPVVSTRLTTLAALNREEKTTARVVVDASTLPDGTELPVLVELHQLRGYEREAERLEKLLVARLAFERSDATTIAQARDAAGAPPFVPSKLRVTLDTADTAVDAWRTVLRELTDIMTANFAGTVADIDSEFLHDFRVAVRRTRSVLKEGKDVLPPGARRHFRDGFKWMGDITTPQRDADVQLLDLPDLLATVPERAEALEPLRELLVEHQAECHRELVADLRSSRRGLLHREWAGFLLGDGAWPTDDGSEPGSDSPDALRPAIVVAAARIHHAHQQLVGDGRKIDDHSPATDLHDLRKDAKRLRYLLECFGSLFPADDIAVAVKPLKALQDTLGTFQDTEVQVHTLTDTGERLVERGAGARTLLAIGAVIEHVSARGTAARHEFADRFATFDGGKVNDAYDRLAKDAEAAT